MPTARPDTASDSGNHRAEIMLHKAAKAAFDESNLKTLPKVKELDAEYSKLLTEKKALYRTTAKRKTRCRNFFVRSAT